MCVYQRVTIQNKEYFEFDITSTYASANQRLQKKLIKTHPPSPTPTHPHTLKIALQKLTYSDNYSHTYNEKAT